MTGFSFEVLATDGAARRGRIHTAHGSVETPAFMPVGTAGTVKGMLPEAVAATGAEIILGNTYHLMLRPGAERVARLGGLHRMANWPRPILTDSGGFQVMSLSGLRQIDEDGVTFRSHIDGSQHRLTPERSIEIQHLLDADITMALDECIRQPASHEETRRALELSTRWARRSKQAFAARDGYGLFGIIQGGLFPDLRAEGTEALVEIGFDGYAIGGLAVGEGQEAMFRVLDTLTLPTGRPRYLMGVGMPSDLLGAVLRGVDMFDCVVPTRSGRTAQAFTRTGKLNLRNARHQDDQSPLDAECACPACTQFTRAYLHHLHRCEEMLGPILLTWHNLTYYQDLMKGIRHAIEHGDLAGFAAQCQRDWESGAASADIPE